MLMMIVFKKSLTNVHDDCVYKNEIVKPVKKNVPKRTYAKRLGTLVARLRLYTTDREHNVYFRDDIWKPTGRTFTLQNGRMSDEPVLPINNFYE